MLSRISTSFAAVATLATSTVLVTPPAHAATGGITVSTTVGLTRWGLNYTHNGPTGSVASLVVKDVPKNTRMTGTTVGGFLKIASPAKYANEYMALSSMTSIQTTSATYPKLTTAPLNTPYTCTGQPLLPVNASATCVKAAQYAMNSWLTRADVPGGQLLTVNGVYSTTLSTDFMLLEKAYGLPQTGVSDTQTWDALAMVSAQSGAFETNQLMGKPGDTHPAFPSTIKLSDGRLMMVFTSARAHIDSSASLWKTYSSDGGYSWTKPAEIDLANGLSNTVGGLGIATSGPLKGHPILTTWTHSIGGNDITTEVIVSGDMNGNTWGSALNLQSVTHDATFTASPIVQLTDTSYIQAIYVGETDHYSARTVGLRWDGKEFLIGAQSTIAANTAADGGLTPGTTTSIGQPSPTNVHVTSANIMNNGASYTEVGITKLKNGDLLSLIRDTATPGMFYSSISTDGGVTWGRPIAAFPATGAPRIATLPNGNIVVLYRKDGPIGTADAEYRLSTDNGKTWGAEHSAGTPTTFEMVYGTPVINSNNTVTFIYGNETSYYKSSFTTNANVTPQH